MSSSDRAFLAVSGPPKTNAEIDVFVPVGDSGKWFARRGHVYSSLRYSLLVAGSVAFLSNVAGANVPGSGESVRIPMPRFAPMVNVGELSLQNVNNISFTEGDGLSVGAISSILLAIDSASLPNPVLPLLNSDPNMGGVAGNGHHHGHHYHNNNYYCGYPSFYGWGWPKYGHGYYGVPPTCEHTTNPVPVPGAALLALVGLMGGAGARFGLGLSKQVARQRG